MPKAKSVTKKWNKDTNDYQTFPKKWESRKEFVIFHDIRTRFEELRTHRQTSCWWPAPPGTSIFDEDTDTTGGGSDWARRWDLDYKLVFMWREYIEQSNLKSPTSWAPVEAFLAEFQAAENGIILSPTREEDKEHVRIQQYALDHLYNIGNFADTKYQSAQECVITGTSFDAVQWVKKEREIEKILTGPEAEKTVTRILENNQGTKAEQELRDRLKKGRPLTQKSKILEYEDIDYIPISIYEIYVDDTARCLQGKTHEAEDLVWVSQMSVEQARNTFENSTDPFILKGNVKKIVSAREAMREYQDNVPPYLRVAQGLIENNLCEVIKYYNKLTDKYIIIVNDVIIRDGPLPYNHKQIPIVMHKFYPMPHMLYGAGMAVMVEPLQSEDETFRNLELEGLKPRVAPPLFIYTDMYADVDQQLDHIEPNIIIETSVPPTPDKARYMEMPSVPFEYFRSRDEIRNDVILTTGVNPLAYSMPAPGEAVRTHMMSLESTLKLLRKGIKNWAKGDKHAARQMLALMEQFYTREYLMDLSGKTEQERYSIELKNVKIAEIDGKLTEKRIQGESYMYLKPEYFQLSGDIRVEIDVDRFLPITKSFKLQKLENAIDKIAIFAQNPQIMEAPGFIQIFVEYLREIGMPPSVIEQFQDEESEDEVTEAEIQEKQMLSGNDIPGIPGESDGHKSKHLSTLLMVVETLKDPTRIPSTEQYLTYQKFHQRLYEHLMTDNLPKNIAVEATLQKEKPTPPQSPPMGAPPGMGGMGMPGGGPPVPGGAMMAGQGGLPPQAMTGQIGGV